MRVNTRGEKERDKILLWMKVSANEKDSNSSKQKTLKKQKERDGKGGVETGDCKKTERFKENRGGGVQTKTEIFTDQDEEEEEEEEEEWREMRSGMKLILLLQKKNQFNFKKKTKIVILP